MNENQDVFFKLNAALGDVEVWKARAEALDLAIRRHCEASYPNGGNLDDADGALYEARFLAKGLHRRFNGWADTQELPAASPALVEGAGRQ